MLQFWGICEAAFFRLMQWMEDLTFSIDRTTKDQVERNNNGDYDDVDDGKYYDGDDQGCILDCVNVHIVLKN